MNSWGFFSMGIPWSYFYLELFLFSFIVFNKKQSMPFLALSIKKVFPSKWIWDISYTQEASAPKNGLPYVKQRKLTGTRYRNRLKTSRNSLVVCLLECKVKKEHLQNNKNLHATHIWRILYKCQIYKTCMGV